MILTDYLSNNPKKHLIFDLDDTLVHLKIDWSTRQKLFWEEAKKFDIDLVSQEPESSTILYNRLILKHGYKGKLFVDKFMENYEAEKFQGYEPKNELIEFIENNKENYSFYVWTANYKKMVMSIIFDLKIENIVQTVVTRDSVNLSKPAPDGFYVILNGRDIARSDFLMIGNNEKHDGGAAKNAGIDFYLV